jgi:hypothetical protein
MLKRLLIWLRIIPKPHVHNWKWYMTTGKGDTTAHLYECECGDKIVKHKGGTFKLDK